MSQRLRDPLRSVLHVLASSGLYGIEQSLLNLLPALERAGWHVTLACMAPRGSPGGRVGEALEELGVAVSYSGFSGRLTPLALGRLYHALRSASPTLVHLHGYKATILAGSICLVNRIPAVATCHSEVAKALDFPRLAAYAALEARVLKRLRGVIAVSGSVRDELAERGIPAGRVDVIANGIDAAAGPRRDPVGPSATEFAPALVLVGRLVREKNIDLALDALARVRVRHPRAGLLIAGDGPLRDELEEEARRLEVTGWVRFLGFVGDVRSLLARSDCFILPSSTEGMPMALLEAMAAGMPIVASAVGGIPSAVTDGVEGLLVPPRDARELSEAVGRVLDNPELAGRLAARARDRFEKDFTSERMAERYTRFYDRALDGSGSTVLGA